MFYSPGVRFWYLNLGPHACEVFALSLCHIPWLLEILKGYIHLKFLYCILTYILRTQVQSPETTYAIYTLLPKPCQGWLTLEQSLEGVSPEFQGVSPKRKVFEYGEVKNRKHKGIELGIQFYTENAEISEMATDLGMGFVKLFLFWNTTYRIFYRTKLVL